MAGRSLSGQATPQRRASSWPCRSAELWAPFRTEHHWAALQRSLWLHHLYNFPLDKAINMPSTSLLGIPPLQCSLKTEQTHFFQHPPYIIMYLIIFLPHWFSRLTSVFCWEIQNWSRWCDGYLHPVTPQSQWFWLFLAGLAEGVFWNGWGLQVLSDNKISELQFSISYWWGLRNRTVHNEKAISWENVLH